MSSGGSRGTTQGRSGSGGDGHGRTQGWRERTKGVQDTFKGVARDGFKEVGTE